MDAVFRLVGAAASVAEPHRAAAKLWRRET
jgi:hypothetical protein